MADLVTISFEQQERLRQLLGYSAESIEPTVAAQNCLSRFRPLLKFPLDPITIAKELGLAVYGGNGPDDINPRKNWSGSLCFDRDGAYLAFNVTESLVRQRFTLAHLLGHYLLKHGPRHELGDNTMYSSQDLCEQEATKFARELLMPSSEVRALYYSGKIKSLQHIASCFGVSTDAIGHRLLDFVSF